MFCLCIDFAPNFDRLEPKPPLRAAPAQHQLRAGTAKSAQTAPVTSLVEGIRLPRGLVEGH